MTVVLETERLILRAITRADLPVLHRIFSDPESMRYYPATKSFDETIAWFEKLAFRSYADHGFGLWAVTDRASGEVLGDCGITLQTTPSGREPEIGYHLRRDYLGRGYAFEAAAACRDYGLEALGFDRIVSIVSPENGPSQRVAAKVHRRWENYRGVTAAGVEMDRFLFISERGTAETTDAATRMAMVQERARTLMAKSGG